MDNLQDIHNKAKKTLTNTDLKERSQHIKKTIIKTAEILGIDLKLNKK
jgi:hypothetical protein